MGNQVILYSNESTQGILSNIQDISGIILDIATVIALLVGGIWTYLLFVKQRLSYPRINITLKVDHIPVTESHNLVYVEIQHDNKGSILFSAEKAELRLRQVIPLDKTISEEILLGKDPLSNEETVVEWPLLYQRNWKFSKDNPFEIEPNEKDSIFADFFLTNEVSCVQLYFYITNVKKKGKSIGWTATKTYKIYNDNDKVQGKKSD